MATVEVQGRLRIKKETLKNAKGSARTAISLLSIAAQITQNVPYLGVISTVLTEFLKIQDEVDTYEKEWKTAMGTARQINAVITKFRKECEHSGADGDFKTELRSAFTDLEQVVLETIEVLVECNGETTGLRARARLWIRRADLIQSIMSCAQGLKEALRLFNTILQVNQLLLLEDIKNTVNEIRDNAPTSPVLPATASSETPRLSISTPAYLRSAPIIFCGRQKEVQGILEAMNGKAPTRVAILGPAGIGKTSIALSVLHHEDVEERYGYHRYFVPCESCMTADDVFHSLARAFNLCSEGNPDLASPADVLAGLRDIRGIVCLDNLETPWEADTANVETLLAEIASLPHLSLLITCRLTDMPPIGWSRPHLEPIGPLDLKESLHIWDSICYEHDQFSRMLVQAVDCVPLAVTLLARLASRSTSKAVWDRWLTEKIHVVASFGQAHRLNNLAASIQLSLNALGNEAALDLLCILSLFQKGLMERHLPSWEKAFKGHLHLQHALALLKQYSLVYVDPYTVHPGSISGNSTIRVLSPIRHHILQAHPAPGHLLESLSEVYCRAREGRISHDLGSAFTFLEIGMARDSTRERCLQTIAHTDEHDCCTLFPQKLLVLAVEMARIYGSPALSALLLRLGLSWKHRFEFKTACQWIQSAVKCEERKGDKQGQLHLLEELAWCNADAARRRSMPPSLAFSRETRLEYLDAAQSALDSARKLLASNEWVLAEDEWVTPARDLDQLQDTIRRRRQANLRSPDSHPTVDSRTLVPLSMQARALHAVSPDAGVGRGEFSV